MNENTKESLCAGAVLVGLIALAALLVFGMMTCDSRAQAKRIETRGPILYNPGQEVTIKTTGEHTVVTGVYGHYNRWQYRCRVAFGRKTYPIGVITNPTQIRTTYELVDFYGFELEAR